jgi:hypothetical protein
MASSLVLNAKSESTDRDESNMLEMARELTGQLCAHLIVGGADSALLQAWCDQ